MTSGRSRHLTKQTGEYLVASKLCREGLIATTFTGNVPYYDIVAVDNDFKATIIQVKTSNNKSWQLNAKTFLEIDYNKDARVQRITGKRKPKHPDLVYVFVRLDAEGEDDFYIIRVSDLQEIVHRNHKAYLRMHGGVRPKNPESTHTAVKVEDLTDFVDNWPLNTGE